MVLSPLTFMVGPLIIFIVGSIMNARGGAPFIPLPEVLRNFLGLSYVFERLTSAQHDRDP